MTTEKVQEIIIRDERTPWFNIHSAYDEMPLSLEAFRALGHLSRRADNNDGCAYPSYTSIGEACFRASYPKSSSTTLRRKAIKAINELIGYGLIRKEIRFKDGSNEHIGNIYALTHSSSWNLTFTGSQNTRTCKGQRDATTEGSAGLAPGSAGLTPPQKSGGGSAGLTLGSAGLTLGSAGLTPGGAGLAPKGYPREGIPKKGIPKKGIPIRTPLCPPEGETKNFELGDFFFEDNGPIISGDNSRTTWENNGPAISGDSSQTTWEDNGPAISGDSSQTTWEDNGPIISADNSQTAWENNSPTLWDESQHPDSPLATERAVADDKFSAAALKPKKITAQIFHQLASVYNNTKADGWAACRACNAGRLNLVQRLWRDIDIPTLDGAITEAKRIISFANAVIKIDPFWGQKVEGTIETLFRDGRYQQLVEKGELKGLDASMVHESGLTAKEIQRGREDAEFLRLVNELERDQEL